jgi:hypothetical protein
VLSFQKKKKEEKKKIYLKKNLGLFATIAFFSPDTNKTNLFGWLGS